MVKCYALASVITANVQLHAAWLATAFSDLRKKALFLFFYLFVLTECGIDAYADTFASSENLHQDLATELAAVWDDKVSCA